MLVFGTKVIYRAVGSAMVHCERCGGDRLFERRSGRRWAQLLGIPVYRLAGTGEHVRCTICLTCYRVELLAVPTIGQMRAALADGTKAAALTMLHAGDQASQAARGRAIELISSAGPDGYGEGELTAELARCCQPAGSDARSGGWPGARLAVQALALQLELHAREWFLSKVVQVGLADGALSEPERQAIATIAGYLGMSQARAQDVIATTEQAAA